MRSHALARPASIAATMELDTHRSARGGRRAAPGAAACIACALLLGTGAAGAAEPVFDVHVHVWNGGKSVREYEEKLKATGQHVTRFGAIHMAVRGKAAETRAKNDELFDLQAEHPALLPIPSVHPYDGDAALEELRRVAKRGARIVKLHPHTQKFDAADPRVRALCEAAGKLGLAVLMDNANIVPGDNQTLFELAIAVPGTRFVFAHLGGLEFRFWNIMPLLKTTEGFFADNVYFDLSATVQLLADSPLEDEFVWTIRNVGVDRVLLGSDYPQLSLADAVQSLERLDLTPEEKRKIRWENAKALLLDPPATAPARKSRQPLRRADD